MKTTGLALAVVLVLLAGCAAAQQRRAALMEEFRRTIPTCRESRECEVKWAAARRWVLNNAGMKLQHVQPDYLETFNSPEYSSRLAVRVVKEPIGGAGYRIVVTTSCWAGCDSWGAAVNFNRYVNAAVP